MNRIIEIKLSIAIVLLLVVALVSSVSTVMVLKATYKSSEPSEITCPQLDSKPSLLPKRENRAYIVPTNDGRKF
jgi:hypothetical protein